MGRDPKDPPVTLDTLDAHDERLRGEMRTLVEEQVGRLVADRRQEQRRVDDRVVALDAMLRGEGQEPGLMAKVSMVLEGQRRRQALEAAGLVLLMGLVVKAVWEVVVGG